MAELLKLNLGCGPKLTPGYVNVDKFGSPDVLLDLESFPWPWETNSVGEVVLRHVLEHLGQTTQLYLGIFKELYRVCAPGALIYIWVPHPRSDDFLDDPTHVRPITAKGLLLFSKSVNRQWIANDVANSPLGMYLDVDFDVANVTYSLFDPWKTRYENKEITSDQVMEAANQYFNVVKETRIILKVNKPGPNDEGAAGAPTP